jgi:hypothetical protein
MLVRTEGLMHTGRSGAGGIVCKRRGLRAYLALFALFVQLWATAGHFHPEDFPLRGEEMSLAASGGAVAPSPASGQPTLPAHDDCPLCFALQIASASAMPGPIALPVLSEHCVAIVPVLPELRLIGAPHLLFQTRAPPTV